MYVTAERELGRESASIAHGSKQINTVPMVLGTVSSVALFVVAVIILWPGRGKGADDGCLPLDDISLLQVSALDTTYVSARFMDVDTRDVTARRRAGMFPVTVDGGRLVPVDGKRGESQFV